MNKFDMAEVAVMKAAIVNAQADLTRYLQTHFPKGARCDVMLSAAQKTPTPATIFGAGGDQYGGSVTVQIDTAKTRSRFRFRHVSPDKVFNVRAAEQADAAMGEARKGAGDAEG